MVAERLHPRAAVEVQHGVARLARVVGRTAVHQPAVVDQASARLADEPALVLGGDLLRVEVLHVRPGNEAGGAALGGELGEREQRLRERGHDRVHLVGRVGHEVVPVPVQPLRLHPRHGRSRPRVAQDVVVAQEVGQAGHHARHLQHLAEHLGARRQVVGAQGAGLVLRGAVLPVGDLDLPDRFVDLARGERVLEDRVAMLVQLLEVFLHRRVCLQILQLGRDVRRHGRNLSREGAPARRHPTQPAPCDGFGPEVP